MKSSINKFLPWVPTDFKIKKNVSATEQRQQVVPNTHSFLLL